MASGHVICHRIPTLARARAALGAAGELDIGSEVDAEQIRHVDQHVRVDDMRKNLQSIIDESSFYPIKSDAGYVIRKFHGTQAVVSLISFWDITMETLSTARPSSVLVLVVSYSSIGTSLASFTRIFQPSASQ